MWHDYIHIAIAEDHPNALSVPHYVWVVGEDGEPFMLRWNEDALGPLDLPAIKARCEELMVRGNVPVAVTRAQALMALYNAGLLPQVEAAVDGHEYLPVKIWFDNALNFERHHTYLQAIAQELSLTDEQVDNLFIAAAQLTA